MGQRVVANDITHDFVPWAGALEANVRIPWEEILQRASHAPLFFYPHWLTLACASGGVRPAGILLIRQGGTPIAVLPLGRQSPGIMEVIPPLASEYIGFPYDPAALPAVCQGISNWLRTQRRVGILRVGRWNDIAIVDAMREAAGHSGVHAIVQPSTPCYWLSLPASWETYLATRGKSTRANLRRAGALLLRDYPDATLEIPTDPAACADILDHLFSLYRLRWQQQVGGCLFSNPAVETFYRELILHDVQRGNALVLGLRVFGRIIAASTLLHIPGQTVAYYHFVARETDALPEQYSPGIYIITHALRTAIARGVTRMAFGSGSAYYKTLLGCENTPYWDVALARSPIAARILPPVGRGLHILRRLPVHIAYHWQQLRRQGAATEERHDCG